MKGGDPGVRLIEPKAGAAPFFRAAPMPFKARKYGWLLVPMHRIFGSEELSLMSPPLAGLHARPFVGISKEDAERLEAEEGEEMTVRSGGREFSLPAAIVFGLVQGVAALALLPGISIVTLPAWGVLARAKKKAA
jgi:NADH-quinone oxidoreductase subunit G